MKLKYLLIFLPISILLYFYNLKELCFFATLISIIPLSSTICTYTGELANKLGDKLGGMINATTGNIPELLISYFALKAHMFDLVKSGLIGSIIGNMLLVQGISIFLGGLKHKEQTFNKNIARTNFGLLFLALTGIIIAAIYNRTAQLSKNINTLSLGISVIFILVYILGLIFSFITHRNLFLIHADEAGSDSCSASRPIDSTKILFAIAIVSLLIILESHILVNCIEYLTLRFKISQSFLGIIIVPIVGNAAEYTTAIVMALKNKVSLCVEIAVGSGMQIALFVAPILTILSFLIYSPFNLVFSTYHITSLIISIGLSFFVFQDGKTYWIEGAVLIASYCIIALGYFFL